MKRMRKKSVEHKLLEIYQYRAVLTKEDAQKLAYLVKGFVGELALDDCLDMLHEVSGIKILKDVRIAYDETHFQIDLLLAIGKVLLHYEVKNYSGEYTMDGEYLTTKYGRRILNPEIQIQRANTMLFNTMKRLGYNFQIRSFCVFVNPDFQIYQNEKMDSVLFAGQLASHFEKVKQITAYPNADMEEFLQKLLVLDDADYRPAKLPRYENVRMGIVCRECCSFKDVGTRQTWICGRCGKHEPMIDAISRTAKEFLFLYPEKSISVRQVFEWCGAGLNHRQIRRALLKDFIQQGHGPATTYLLKEMP